MKLSQIILILSANSSIVTANLFSFTRPKTFDLSNFKRTESADIEPVKGFSADQLYPTEDEKPKFGLLKNRISLPKISSKSSPNTSPRSSASSLSSSKSSKSSNSVSTKSWDSESSLGEMRSGSSGRPTFVANILDFRSLQPVDWRTLPSDLSLTEDQNKILKQSSEACGYYLDLEFRDKVIKTLRHVTKTVPLNNFLIHLAIEMVIKHGNRAPNAMNLFIDSRMAFMKTPSYVHDQLAHNIKNQLSDVNGNLFENEKFLNHIDSLFLDYFHNKPEIDLLMLIYMQIFSKVKNVTDFVRKYALMVKCLIELTSKLSKKEDVNVADIEYTLRFNFDEFEMEVNKVFGIDN